MDLEAKYGDCKCTIPLPLLGRLALPLEEDSENVSPVNLILWRQSVACRHLIMGYTEPIHRAMVVFRENKMGGGTIVRRA